MQNLYKKLQGLRRDIKGAIAVEFAIILPVAITLLVGIMEVAFMMFVSATVENAVMSASRYGAIGNTSTGLSREEAILEIVADNNFGVIDMDDVTLTTTVYSSFEDIGEEEPYVDANASETYDAGEEYSDVNGNGQWDEDMGIAGVGGTGDIVVYQISYSTNSLTALLDFVFGSIVHSAVIAIRNEPF